LPILIIGKLEEEHPAKLRDALCVTINAAILTQDILNRF
jgi:hypothetical protein